MADDLVRALDRTRVAVVLSIAVLAIPIAFALIVPHPLDQAAGVDFQLYRDAAARWLHGGTFYEPYQLAGVYNIRPGDIPYPPVALRLFVPFAIEPPPRDVIAGVAWWATP